MVTFTDDFNRADGALGTGWKASPAGSLRVVGNEVGASTFGDSAGAFESMALVDSPNFTGDCYVEVDVTARGVGSYAQCGLVARVVDSGNYYALYAHNDGNSGNDRIVLYKRVGTAWTELDSHSVTHSFPFRLRLEVVGDTLTGYLDGAEVVSGTASDLASGDVGIATRCLPSAVSDDATLNPQRLDNFEAGEVGAPSAVQNFHVGPDLVTKAFDGPTEALRVYSDGVLVLGTAP